MNYRFEYRIGRSAQYSDEQWEKARGNTVSETIHNLKTVEPDKWAYDVYAVIVEEGGEIDKISKHPCQVVRKDSFDAMRKELALYANASKLPIFDRDDFDCWDYLAINSDDISESTISFFLRT